MAWEFCDRPMVYNDNLRFVVYHSISLSADVPRRKSSTFFRKLLTEKYTEYEFGTLFELGGFTKPNLNFYDYEKEIYISPALYLELRNRQLFFSYRCRHIVC